MGKKILFSFLILLTVSILVYTFIRTKKSDGNKTYSPVIDTKEEATDSASTVRAKTYNDQAGFTFSYPKDVQVAPMEITDNNVYSSLSLTSKEKQGNILIEAISSNLKNIDDLFKAPKKNIRKLKLADLEARQFEEEGKMTTVALDQGVLFTIIVDYKTEKDFWTAVNNQVIASFAFVAPKSQKASTESDEDIIFEGEEEVIE